jgi:hypothetical protein
MGRLSKKPLSQQTLEEVRARWAAEDALTAHAELRSALKIVQRVVESVEAPAGTLSASARSCARGDRVAVYPKFEAFDISPLLREREQPLREIRFVADAHHGSPARLLRMMGFDTLYANAFADDEIERMAATQGRIVHWQPMRALVEPCKLRDFDS